jgi:hypothetical protein
MRAISTAMLRRTIGLGAAGVGRTQLMLAQLSRTKEKLNSPSAGMRGRPA